MSAENVYIPGKYGGIDMTKDKFLFELIDRCMLITCQDNILAENFALRDDLSYYEENEKQFCKCMSFYNDMLGLVNRGEITETVMDQELYSVLALIRQRAMQQMLNDFKVYLNQTRLKEDLDDEEKKKIEKEIEKEVENLEMEFETENIDSEYLLMKIKDYRKAE